MQNKTILAATANQYPHRINHFSRCVRMLLSFAPKLGLISSPDKPEGISVMMRVKNEVDWIESSIQSVLKIADEIIIADNGSSDGTYEILEKISMNENKVKLWRETELNYLDFSNFVLNKTCYRWVFKWDGDFIAHTNGKYDIAKLRNRILSLDPERHYVIYLKLINLSGDLNHHDANEMVHIEEYLYTYFDSARYIHPGRFEAVKFPKYHRVLFWYEPYVFHVNIKPARRMLLRYFWEEWMEIKDYMKFLTLEDYVTERIRDEFGTASWEEAEKTCVERILINHIPYNEQQFGPYPDLLKPYLEKPKYRLAYENGRIVGREED